MTTDTWNTSDDARQYGAGLLRGERVHLRELRESDPLVLAGWWNTPEWSALQQHLVKPLPAQSVVEMYQQWSENKPGTADAGFSVVRTSDDKLIGHIALFGATMTARSAEFAILIGPEFVGRGLGLEASRLMIAYGFNELGLNRIGLSAWAYNDRAIATYEKVGFQVEGRRRSVGFHNGQFHDEVLMGILASEHTSD